MPMSSLFQEAAAKASAAIDAVYGETFLFHPMARAADVNARASADPARAVTTIVAAFHDIEARGGSDLVGERQMIRVQRPMHASDRPQISFARDALPFAPRPGDRMTRAACGKTYQLAEPRHSDGPRHLFDVNLVG